jgi:beta-mannosidase
MNFLIKFTLLVKFVIVDSISITKWELCKILSNGTDNTSFDLMDCRKIRRLGTVLSKLIEWNNTYSQTCRDDIYYGSNLQNIPDIAVYGNSFYTYAYKTRIELSELWQNKIIQIKLNGINYKPKFFFNDIELIDNQSPASGMFRSYSLDVTNLIDWNMKENNILVIIVYPPDIPGSSSSGSQGGDHKIAKNGGIMQCTAGWDWIQATPDRNTGIWDEVELTVSGYLEVTYPVIRTSIIHYHNFSAILEAEVLIVNHLKENILNAMVFISIYDKNNINIKKISQKINILSLSTQTIVLFNIELENVNLWWPHTHGDPYIYKATFEVYVENNDATSNILLIPSSSETIQFGIRTATGYLDESTEGWAFRINNVPIFIIGGNWIASDQLLRYILSLLFISIIYILFWNKLALSLYIFSVSFSLPGILMEMKYL